MAKGPKVQLDHRGIEAVLNSSEVVNMVNDAAQRIARAVGGGYAADVSVEPYVARGGRLMGERPAAAVVLRNPRGAGIEAKYAPLARAAAAAGFTVVGR